jgi:hypothetical protein
MSFFIRANVSGFIPAVSYDIAVFSFYRLFRLFCLEAIHLHLRHFSIKLKYTERTTFPPKQIAYFGNS